MGTIDTARARMRLAAERARLEQVMAAAHRVAEASAAQAHMGGPQVDHPTEEAAVEAFEMEKDELVEQRVTEDLAEVDAALRRLVDGTYGRCEVCGQEISAERLDAVPATRLCLRDQAVADRARRAQVRAG